MWDEPGGLRVDYRGVEEEVGGSSSRRVSQEFKKLYNIFEQNGQSVSPRRLSFSRISTNGRVGSVRKVKKIASVHTSVGPISTSTTVYSSESESIMGTVSVSKRINGRTILAGTRTNRKRGRGEDI